MKVKTAIRIIELFAFYLSLLLLSMPLIFLIIEKTKYSIFFSLLIYSPFLMIFFFRNRLIKQFLKQTKYPGVFFSVCDSLNLTTNIEIELSDEILNDIHNPLYSTEKILTDNELYVQYDPAIRFTEQAFHINNLIIDWKNVFNWIYVKGNRGTTDKIDIAYHHSDRSILTTRVDLGLSNIDKIDFLMLLTHCKGKFGKS